jgi:Mlc titration factor MtfA (ptsG expression regulator)
MVFAWLRSRRRKRILEQPFPSSWESIVAENVAHYAYLSAEEQARLRDLIQVFVDEKHWEGAGGQVVGDQVKVTIAAQACLLILGLDHDLYRRVESIIVYPSTVVTRSSRPSFFDRSTDVAAEPMPILGQAFQRGPVVLVWDGVLSGGIDPRDGRNVVYHEFAHKLDMLSGRADGVPPQQDRATYDTWVEVLTREYNALQERADAGKQTFLDRYALTNPAEFFSVATEHFFEQPRTMRREHREMYDVLAGFYRQDTAARENAHRASRRKP